MECVRERARMERDRENGEREEKRWREQEREREQERARERGERERDKKREKERERASERASRRATLLTLAGVDSSRCSAGTDRFRWKESSVALVAPSGVKNCNRCLQCLLIRVKSAS
eukprot:6188490-Pleurochrysis_carterae.AAC.1